MRSVPRTGEERQTERLWRLRPTGAASLSRFPVYLSVLLGVPAVFAAITAADASAKLVLLGIALGLACAAAAVVRGSHIDAYPDRLEFHTMVSRPKTAQLNEVSAISVTWSDERWGYNYYEPTGYRIGVHLASKRRMIVWSLALPQHALHNVQTLIETYQPEVVLNPTPPWLDRFGRWHGDHLDEDPVEAMRSVRRAFVGPWVIRASAKGDGTWQATLALVQDASHPLEQGEVRSELNVAVEDAVRLVRRSMSELHGQ